MKQFAAHVRYKNGPNQRQDIIRTQQENRLQHTHILKMKLLALSLLVLLVGISTGKFADILILSVSALFSFIFRL